MRIDALDNLAVKFEDKAQDAMRGRMLRTPVQRKIADSVFAHIARLLLSAPVLSQCGLFLAFSSPGRT